MTHKLQITIALILTALTAIAIWFMNAPNANANPSTGGTPAVSTATTSSVYMTAGTATTTRTLDATQGRTLPKADNALVVFQYTATNTAAILKARVEDSYDGIDWYPRAAATNANATTTVMTEAFSELSFRMATGTDFGGSGSATRIHQSFQITVPSNYVRVVFYGGSGVGALWANIYPVKEVK